MRDDKRRFLPISRPVLGKEEADAAARAIASGWVTQGPEVLAFERELAAYVGAPLTCAASSCTAALHLALAAVGVKAGDEVVTASHSFIATANSVRYAGALPVFADIDPKTFNLDPARVEAALTSKTKAILLVHQLGMPSDLAALVEIARRKKLPLIEDAACAIGSEILFDGRWERIGRPRGDIACFSFHPRKLLTTGDGGMLTYADPALDERLRHLRHHGMSVSDAARHASAQVIFEEYAEVGYNYRLTDVQAAMGREQLKKLPGVIGRRREQAAIYRELLCDIPGLGLPYEPPWAKSNWQSFCVILPDGVDQRAFMQAALDAGIATRRAVMCAHREPAYAREGGEPWSCGDPHRCRGRACERLRESERAQDRGVILPLFHEMTRPDQERVAGFVRGYCGS